MSHRSFKGGPGFTYKKIKRVRQLSPSSSRPKQQLKQFYSHKGNSLDLQSQKLHYVYQKSPPGIAKANSITPGGGLRVMEMLKLNQLKQFVHSGAQFGPAPVSFSSPIVKKSPGRQSPSQYLEIRDEQQQFRAMAQNQMKQQQSKMSNFTTTPKRTLISRSNRHQVPSRGLVKSRNNSHSPALQILIPYTDLRFQQQLLLQAGGQAGQILGPPMGHSAAAGHLLRYPMGHPADNPMGHSMGRPVRHPMSMALEPQVSNIVLQESSSKKTNSDRHSSSANPRSKLPSPTASPKDQRDAHEFPQLTKFSMMPELSKKVLNRIQGTTSAYQREPLLVNIQNAKHPLVRHCFLESDRMAGCFIEYNPKQLSKQTPARTDSDNLEFVASEASENEDVVSDEGLIESSPLKILKNATTLYLDEDEKPNPTPSSKKKTEVIRKEFKPWDVYWSDHVVSERIFAKLLPWQVVNHFPGLNTLADYSHLMETSLKKMKKLFPEDYKIFPKTWIFQPKFDGSPGSLEELAIGPPQQVEKKILLFSDKQREKNTEQGKPDAPVLLIKQLNSTMGSNSGASPGLSKRHKKNYILTNNWRKAKDQIVAAITAKMRRKRESHSPSRLKKSAELSQPSSPTIFPAAQKDTYLVQQAISSPAELDGYKIHFEFYAILTSCQPLTLYFHEQGIAVLNNLAIDEDSQEDSFDTYLDGFKYKKKLEESNEVIRKICWKFANGQPVDQARERLMVRIKDVAIKTMLSIQADLVHNYKAVSKEVDPMFIMDKPPPDQCFQIVMFKMMIDQNLKPWLLKLEAAPSFEFSQPKKDIIMKKILIDALALLDISSRQKLIKREIYRLEPRQSKLTLEQQLMAENYAKFFHTKILKNSNANGFKRIFPLAKQGLGSPKLGQEGVGQNHGRNSPSGGKHDQIKMPVNQIGSGLVRAGRGSLKVQQHQTPHHPSRDLVIQQEPSISSLPSMQTPLLPVLKQQKTELFTSLNEKNQNTQSRNGENEMRKPSLKIEYQISTTSHKKTDQSHYIDHLTGSQQEDPTLEMKDGEEEKNPLSNARLKEVSGSEDDDDDLPLQKKLSDINRMRRRTRGKKHSIISEANSVALAAAYGEISDLKKKEEAIEKESRKQPSPVQLVETPNALKMSLKKDGQPNMIRNNIISVLEKSLKLSQALKESEFKLKHKQPDNPLINLSPEFGGRTNSKSKAVLQQQFSGKSQNVYLRKMKHYVTKRKQAAAKDREHKTKTMATEPSQRDSMLLMSPSQRLLMSPSQTTLMTPVHGQLPGDDFPAIMPASLKKIIEVPEGPSEIQGNLLPQMSLAPEGTTLKDRLNSNFLQQTHMGGPERGRDDESMKQVVKEFSINENDEDEETKARVGQTLSMFPQTPLRTQGANSVIQDYVENMVAARGQSRVSPTTSLESSLISKSPNPNMKSPLSNRLSHPLQSPLSGLAARRATLVPSGIRMQILEKTEELNETVSSFNRRGTKVPRLVKSRQSRLSQLSKGPSGMEIDQAPQLSMPSVTDVLHESKFDSKKSALSRIKRETQGGLDPSKAGMAILTIDEIMAESIHPSQQVAVSPVSYGSKHSQMNIQSSANMSPPLAESRLSPPVSATLRQGTKSRI